MEYSLILRAEAELELRKRESLKTRYNWRNNARENQLPPLTPWAIWLILAGRGFGKTRTGAEWVREQVNNATSMERIALVGRTPADVRDVMIEGESGIMNVTPAWERPVYESSKRKLTWKNGCVAYAYSSESPDKLRGPEHNKAWADEIATFYNQDAWDNLRFGMRLGDNPQIVATTTPRPTTLIRELFKDLSIPKTSGNTYDNKDNLPAVFIEEIKNRYEGTTLGRQEIYAEILDEIQGALWDISLIDKCRVKKAPPLKYIIVAVDPAVTSNPDSDETGIIVAGLGYDNHGYVLADSSCRKPAKQWAQEVLRLYDFWGANKIIAEVNNGGDLVIDVIKTVSYSSAFKVEKVHATQGKMIRAEPVQSLYQQFKIHHVGVFPALEDQMCSWSPITDKKSPDRVDALVWAFTKLMVKGRVGSPQIRCLN